MKEFFAPLLMTMVCACAAASTPKLTPLKTVPAVDLKRYLGTWYEIASYPQWFQKGCVAVKAEYSLRDDGAIRVINSCRKETFDGELKVAKGKAWVVEPLTNAKLKVRFFWPFSGDYWIIDLGADYEYAVVGAPGRDYLWILSRTPVMSKAVLDGILARLEAQGYDTTRLVPMKHPQQ
jgi:apolipoprotein D and lipocalin family protein